MSRIRIVPSARPKLDETDLIKQLNEVGIDLDLTSHPLWFIGIRGYYLDSMGEENFNDRGIYDDAIFIYTDPKYRDGFRSFNANTDPGYVREGYGRDPSTKGMARLKPGLYYSHRFDRHNDEYLAICQRERPVTVIRDGIDGKDYEHTGLFGINIHRGKYSNVSSIGCQTIYPSQWPEFIETAEDFARFFFNDNWNKVYLPYALIEYPL